MNHWLLVGRDLMWLAILMIAPILFHESGRLAACEESGEVGTLFVAFSVYISIIVCLYCGFIS